MNNAELRTLITSLEITGHNCKKEIKAAKVNRIRFQLFRYIRVDLTDTEITAVLDALEAAGLYEPEE